MLAFTNMTCVNLAEARNMVRSGVVDIHGCDALGGDLPDLEVIAVNLISRSIT